MRHTRHIAMGVLLALGASGCGGLDNAPFRIGTVSGRIQDLDSSVAVVSVMGAPNLRGNVAGDGSFTIEKVPAGAAELFIIASDSKALRVPLIVQGGQSVSVGLLTPKEAGFLSLRVKAPSYERVNTAEVSLMGTPVEGLQLDPSGRLTVGPLPEGCYTLAISLQGFPEVSTEVCVTMSELTEVRVNLPPPTAGCAVTGCAEEFICMPDGRCVECTDDIHCGSGLSCRDSRCEGEGGLCAPCMGDWQCGGETSCQEHRDGILACLGSCADSDDCKQGFTCQSGLCLPDSSRFMGCAAYLQLGAACESDQQCRNAGLVSGICVEERCTFSCTGNRECPEGSECQPAPGGRVCVLK